MGQIQTSFIKTINTNLPKIFVETGTYLGGIPLSMLADRSFDEWDKIYTIELSEKLCRMCSVRYKMFEDKGVGYHFETYGEDEDDNFKDKQSYFDGKLNLLQGDSAIRLKDVMDEVDERCAFWLDAHAGAKELYTRGEVDCPLIEELNIIKEHKIKNHLITIDDAHLFGKTEYKDGKIVCDYSEITKEKIEGIIKSINPEYTIEYPSPYGQLMLVAYVKKQDIESSTWWKD